MEWSHTPSFAQLHFKNSIQSANARLSALNLTAALLTRVQASSLTADGGFVLDREADFRELLALLDTAAAG